MGYAARANRARKRQGTVLTAEKCRQLAASVRTSLATLSIEPAGDIEAFLSDAEWLGASPIDPFDEGGVAFLERERGVPAFLRMEQLIRLDQTLAWATGIENAASVAKWVREKFDRIAQLDEQAQDYLFELELAALAKRASMGVTLGEPDILLGIPGFDPSVSLACKRPLRISTVGRAILKARDQITKKGLPGLIVIGMEAIFHHSEDPTRRVAMYRADSLQDLVGEGQRRIGETIAATSTEIEQAFGSEIVHGILFCGGITGMLPQGYTHEWVRRPEPRPGADPRTVRLISLHLFEGT